MPSNYRYKLDMKAEQVQRAVDRSVARAMANLGERAEDIARQLVPYRTGALYRSIYSLVAPGLLVLGAHIYYSPYVEAHTPFLYPALEMVRDSFPGEVRAAFGSERP